MSRRTRYGQLLFGARPHRRRMTNQGSSSATFHRRLRIELLEDRRLLSITVNTLVDENNGIGVGGVSLRDAIAAAASGDTIVFASSLTSGGPATITLIHGELLINKDLSISGPGASLLTIDASGNDPTPTDANSDGTRVFNIDDNNANTLKNVMISGLKLTGGDTNLITRYQGGAVLNFENLTISGCTISGNASYGGGGGICSYGYGGSLTVLSSTISGNASIGPDGDGGGIANYSGNLTVTSSTISGNSVAGGGGGIHVENTPVAGIQNCTISGNSAGEGGGGFDNEGVVAIILNSTITQNSAPAGLGAGVASNILSTGRTEVQSTIIAGNYGSDVDASFEANPNSFQSNGYNLIGTGDALAAFNQTGDQTGVLNPMVDPLADNGGPTLTQALAVGSPAFDAGDPAAVAGVGSVPPYDQRGVPFTRVIGRIDIGAVETETVTYVVDTLVDESDGDYSAGDLSLREAIELSNAATAAVTIQFDPSLDGGTIVLTQGQLLATRSVFIDGPGAKLLTIDGSGNDPTPEQDNGDGSRVLRISDSNASTLRNVWIDGATITGADLTGSGGAIFNFETLTLTDVVVAGNHVTGVGGAIASQGNLNVIDSLISGNSGATGGIWSYTDFARKLTTRITNSTISGNTSTFRGGGVYNGYGRTVISHSTITNNTAPAGQGSGVASFGDAVTLTEVYSSIIAGNTNSDVDFTSSPTNTFQSNGFNLIGTGNAASAFTPHSADFSGVTDPLLGPLADNGGPTMTHALLTGSQAIDSGDPNSVAGSGTVPLYDQRGAPFTRVYDGDGFGGARIDIGAYERQLVDAISFTGAYAQNFDTLPTSGATLFWSNNSTLAGWSLYRQPAPGTAISTFNVGDGSSSTGSFYSFGVLGDGPITDRALGGLGSGGSYFSNPATGAVAGWFALALTNDTGAEIDTLSLGYDGEQWRDGGNTNPQTMTLEYGFGNWFITVPTWTAPGGSFDFTSPIHTATAAALDGNAATNRTAGLGGTLNDLGWTAGQTLWVRWVENNDAGADHALAIDNIQIGLPAAFFGDYNADGSIDAADYIVWRKTLGDTVAKYSGADGSGNGTIDQPDYDIWRMNFGNTVPAAGAGIGTAADTALAEPVAPGIALSTPVQASKSTQQSRVSAPAFNGLAAAVAIDSDQLRVEPRQRPSIGAQLSAASNAASRLSDDALVAWLSARTRSQHRNDGEEVVASHDDSTADANTNMDPDSLDVIFASLSV